MNDLYSKDKIRNQIHISVIYRTDIRAFEVMMFYGVNTMSNPVVCATCEQANAQMVKWAKRYQVRRPVASMRHIRAAILTSRGKYTIARNVYENWWN